MTDTLMTDDETAVRAVCTAFGQAMQAMDLEALKDLWDDSYDHLVYQPEEYEVACTTWDAIVDYWRYIPGVVGRIVDWREISSDVAVIGEAALVYSAQQLVAGQSSELAVSSPCLSVTHDPFDA